MARNKAFDPQERLEKAQDLFIEKGYSATSMQDLVDGMQLNRASIYDTYGDKHALFQQCLKNYAKDQMQGFKQCCKETSPLAAVEHIMRSTLDKCQKGKTSCLMVKTSFEMASMDEGIKEMVQQEAKQRIAVLQDLLEKAKELKEIPADKDPATLAQFLYASFSSLWMMDVLFNDKRMLDKLVDHILNSVRH
jgi:TetR/AcrR family transcriptional repressor of nem operon